MSIFDISLETANEFYAWGWRFSIVGAVITAFAVFFLNWGTRIRDHSFESQVGQLHLSAAQADERAAALEKGNLELQTTLERERIERLKLEAAIAPRRLSAQQRDILSKELGKIEKPFSIFIKMIFSDQEAGLYANEIVSAITKSPATFSVSKTGVVDPPPYGIQLTLLKNTKASQVRTAFEKAGIPIFSVSTIDEAQADAIVLVGHKPIAQ